MCRRTGAATHRPLSSEGWMKCCTGRFPGFRILVYPRGLPGLAPVAQRDGSRLPGYSGGTAPDSHRLPYYLPAQFAPQAPGQLPICSCHHRVYGTPNGSSIPKWGQSPALLVQLDKPRAHGIKRRLGPVRDAQLLEDMRQMVLGRLLADEEPVGNVPVRGALPHQL